MEVHGYGHRRVTAPAVRAAVGFYASAAGAKGVFSLTGDRCRGVDKPATAYLERASIRTGMFEWTVPDLPCVATLTILIREVRDDETHIWRARKEETLQVG